MKVGDMIKYIGHPRTAQGRSTGVILKFDVYRGSTTTISTPIALILWESGRGWISEDQIEAVNEDR
tara:strand:+ start:353 stop:550 length:198 start_codon:yes stop_codon:yes gene_type:complete